jgi:hypothetical protein
MAFIFSKRVLKKMKHSYFYESPLPSSIFLENESVIQFSLCLKAGSYQGIFWHTVRKCWYYKPKEWKNKRTKHSDKSLEEISRKYRYKGFHTADKERMPAPY